jgi:YgiT-type zinc finger domain-containing protein
VRCIECGNEGVRPSERRLQIDRGRVFEIPMPAVECEVCGRAYVDDRDAARRLELASSATLAPPPEPKR